MKCLIDLNQRQIPLKVFPCLVGESLPNRSIIRFCRVVLSKEKLRFSSIKGVLVDKPFCKRLSLQFWYRDTVKKLVKELLDTPLERLLTDNAYAGS